MLPHKDYSNAHALREGDNVSHGPERIKYTTIAALIAILISGLCLIFS